MSQAPDLKQIQVFKYLFDKEGGTFGNYYRSFLKAGYSDEYASNVTSLMPKWLEKGLSEIIGDEEIIKLAEDNVVFFLKGEDEKLKADMTKFVLSRLNKKKWSERTEVTGKDGEPITGFNFISNGGEHKTDNKAGASLEDPAG